MANRTGDQHEKCDELLDLSRANAQAVVIATAAFLEESGVPVEAWAHYLGRLFANAWDRSVVLSASDFLDAMLVNYRSLGAEVLSVKQGDGAAEATITGFPKEELGLELRLETGPALAYLHVPESLAEDHGLRWSWSVDGSKVRLRVTTAGRD